MTKAHRNELFWYKMFLKDELLKSFSYNKVSYEEGYITVLKELFMEYALISKVSSVYELCDCFCLDTYITKFWMDNLNKLLTTQKFKW